MYGILQVMITMGMRRALRVMMVVLAAPLLAVGCTGCIVAGVGPNGGFIWPGGLGLLFIILLVVFLLRRR